MALYAVISFVAVAFVIAMDVIFYAYKNFHFFPKLAITLYVIAPIFVAILSYIKILMQKKNAVAFQSDYKHGGRASFTDLCHCSLSSFIQFIVVRNNGFLSAHGVIGIGYPQHHDYILFLLTRVCFGL